MKNKKFKAGYYLSKLNNFIIMYPDQSSEILLSLVQDWENREPGVTHIFSDCLYLGPL